MQIEREICVFDGAFYALHDSLLLMMPRLN